jgi:acetyl-CoA synthetase
VQFRVLQNVETFDYKKIRSSFSLDIPDDFNFAFDVLAKKGAEADKTALIAIDQAGNHLADVSYKQLDRSSSRFANALLALGVAKNDNVAVILPRIPE